MRLTSRCSQLAIILFFTGILFLCAADSVLSQTPAPAETPKEPGIFKRENQKQDWQKQVPGVDYSASKDIAITYGDVLATRGETLVFQFGNYRLWIQPNSVFRLNSIAGPDAAVVVPEVLFGEAMFQGERGLVMLPGQSIQAAGTAYFVVDEEKFSIMASVMGQQIVLPQGSDQQLTLDAAKMMDLGSAGETGEPFDMFPDDVAFYSESVIPDDAPRVSVKSGQQAITLEQLNEYWTQTRVDLLQHGPESDVGLAIARGEHRKQAAAQDTVQVFDGSSGPVQKTLSFSTAVGSTDGAATTPGAPTLTSVTIAGKAAALGDLVSLKQKDLDDNSIRVTGKATAEKPEDWKLYAVLNDEETVLDGVTSFEYAIRVTQEFPNSPTVYNVTIADLPAESFEEDSVLTRDHLESGRIKIAGNASPGQNLLNFRLEIVARDQSDHQETIGTFPIELDLSELENVEISLDDGISWEAVTGAEDWTYSLSPMDTEEYKIRARDRDVMGNLSEEQFEPYTFTYRYKTDEETLREAFDTLMRAFLDKDRNTFLRSTSQEFSSNIEDLRDQNELETSLEERFRCCTANIQYTIQNVYANRQSRTGSVEFNWTDKTGVSRITNYAIFNFLFEEGLWLFSEVIDPDTFLRASREAFLVELEIPSDTMTADGEESQTIRAHVLDNAGSIVADNVEVVFTTDNGTFSPATALTVNGYASSVYTVSTTPGVANVSATSGNAADTGSITLNPIAPPLPPDQEP